MGIKSLAEAVILQSMEDYWSPSFRVQSIDFFKGDGFKICAHIAGLDAIHKLEIMSILGGTSNDKPVGLYRS